MHLEKGVTARKSALFIKSSSFAVESKSHGNDLSSQFQFHPNKWPGQKNASRANPNSSSLPLLQLDENHLISGRIPLPNCTSEYTRAPKPKMSQAHRFLRENSNRRRVYTLEMRSDARIIPAWTSASHISLPFGGSCATRILSWRKKEHVIAPMRPMPYPRRLAAESLRLSLTQSACFSTSSQAAAEGETMTSTSLFTSKPNRFHQNLSLESGLSAGLRFMSPHQNLFSCSSLNAAHLKKRSILASPFARFTASTQRHWEDYDNETSACYLARSTLSQISPSQPLSASRTSLTPPRETSVARRLARH